MDRIAIADAGGGHAWSFTCHRLSAGGVSIEPFVAQRVVVGDLDIVQIDQGYVLLSRKQWDSLSVRLVERVVVRRVSAVHHQEQDVGDAFTPLFLDGCQVVRQVVADTGGLGPIVNTQCNDAQVRDQAIELSSVHRVPWVATRPDLSLQSGEAHPIHSKVVGDQSNLLLSGRVEVYRSERDEVDDG